ncbi:TetR/AcrR family transcriptional regulator [Shimazuella alba]|uniref:TetR family transcriptional regulator n=1 Tax=Shimazuella alba TaxID=2690964 RepID=A0A6I4VVS7_9BACL|nr:TetR/AcrR family transcriptional regulator [Shimazuella alba]MXQ54215.1 TetR family transcriptional regulator [Shimazuella alba]
MPRTKAQYKAMRVATKNKIHSSAIKLFAKKGFAATSVQDIAFSAGISIGLLYRHYNTKEELFNDLVSYAAKGLETLIKKFQSETAPIELIQQFTLEVLHDLENDDEFAQFFMIMNQSSAIEDPSPQIQYLNSQSEAMLEQTARLIEKGQELGQFKQGNASEMAFYYFASIQGLAMIKFSINERFITPSPKLVTAFLIKEDYYK